MAPMFSPPQDVQPTIASVARKRSGSRRAASPSSCGKSLARVVWKGASDTSHWRDDQPVKHNIWRVLHPGDEVEGLVDCMVRGGSSPLGRTGSSARSGVFAAPSAPRICPRHGGKIVTTRGNVCRARGEGVAWLDVSIRGLPVPGGGPPQALPHAFSREGYPFSSGVLELCRWWARITWARMPSCWRGFRMRRRAWASWSGCAGLTVSGVHGARRRPAGGRGMGGSSAGSALIRRRRRLGRCLRRRGRRCGWVRGRRG